MPWIPPTPGEIPTLGFEVLDWIMANLSAPDRADYEPFIPYREQADFLLRWYELDEDGRRKYRRGVLSRPRGWGKSPFLAAIAAAEALGPVVFDGWDAKGQPVGKPWATVRTPLVQVAAISEQQTGNSWSPLLEMLDGPAVDNYPGLEPMQTLVNLPRGKIEPVTASWRTVKGARAVFAVLDQTEVWVPSNSGPKLADTMRTNAGKIGGTTIESPNAYTPGELSVAEESAETHRKIVEGKTIEAGLLYDHREAPPDTDLEERHSLRHGLLVAYGDAAVDNGGHEDLDRLMLEIWDPGKTLEASRSDYLNQITHATDSWISQPEWSACVNVERVLTDGEMITLGFDGSQHRQRGVTDATALIACCVSDGHLFELGVWEQPSGPAGIDWWAPVHEVDAAVKWAKQKWQVVGFFADPAKWADQVASWEALFAQDLKVKVTRDRPIAYFMHEAAKVARAIDEFESAVRQHQLSHDGSYALGRHILNARRRPSTKGMAIAKPHPDSSSKIDAAVAAILARQARLEAVARGVTVSQSFVPRRIR